MHQPGPAVTHSHDGGHRQESWSVSLREVIFELPLEKTPELHRKKEESYTRNQFFQSRGQRESVREASKEPERTSQPCALHQAALEGWPWLFWGGGSHRLEELCLERVTQSLGQNTLH